MKRHIWLLVGLVLAIALLTGCNNDPLPEERFKAFIKDWEKQDFNKVYDQFSTDVKQNVKKDEFVERYSKIFKDIEVSDIEVDFKAPEEEVEPNDQGEVAFTYDLSMETIAGTVEFKEEATLILEEKEEEKNWAVRWEPATFFPDMQEGDQIGLESSSPTRGEILDRNGIKLAENGLVYEIGLVPQDLGENKEETIRKVAELLGLIPESIEKSLTASWVQPDYFVPIANLSIQDQELATELTQLPGVLSKKVESRVYPFKDAAAHLTGYIGQVTAEDLKDLEGKGYSGNDVVGKKGLEFVFEDRLRGEKGIHLFIKKENEGEVTLAKKEKKDGENITLTIDIDVQIITHDQLYGNAGAAAVIHPKTGEALALVSSPSFDPNAFVLGNARSTELNEDPLKPLLNRFNLTYAPGSTFKPITAGIALENGVITPDTSIDVIGKQWQKDNSWGGYYITRVTDPGKPVNLRDALVYSDNIYFAQAALGIGGEKFESELKEYGFGEPFPFEYPIYESKVSNEGLNKDTLTADTGYGQGQLQMSPIHLAVSFTPFINEGNLIKPKLVMNASTEPVVWKENVVSPENAQIILDDLVQVVEDPSGTARDAKIEGIKLAGKTGTAELKATKEEEGQENGWFVAFNTENPSLLVAMLIEDVKNGSNDVKPKVKAVIESIVK